jgi:hypothetical protein
LSNYSPNDDVRGFFKNQYNIAAAPQIVGSSRPPHYPVTAPSGTSLPHFGGNPGAVGLMINENTSHGDEDDISDDENATESQMSPGHQNNLILHQ